MHRGSHLGGDRLPANEVKRHPEAPGQNTSFLSLLAGTRESSETVQQLNMWYIYAAHRQEHNHWSAMHFEPGVTCTGLAQNKRL
jgi:hypothetical protein